MRVVLLNPPAAATVFRDGYCSSSSKSGYCWHPLDLVVQSGILTGFGHDVALIDAIALRLSPEETLRRVDAHRPDALLALAGDVSFATDAPFLNRLNVPRLLLSGDVPRFETARTFREVPALDAVVADFTTDGVHRFLEGEARPEGLHMRTGGLTMPTARTWSSPPARHDLLSRRAYRLPFHGAQPFASVLASYGCPFACTFCNTGALGFRTRAAAEVLEELRYVRRLGYRRLYLRDATANGKRAHFLELLRAWAREDLGLAWNAFCTFQPFDAELARAMAAAGCAVVQFGVETGSAALRAETGKAFTNEAAEAAVRYAHEAGLRVCGHFVLGLPGQDVEDVQRTAEFARHLDLDWASFNLASARPGTPLRARADAAGIGGGDASGDGFIEGLASVSAAELRRLRREAIVRFYLRPRPLRALLPDLSRREGWTHLRATALAVARSF